MAQLPRRRGQRLYLGAVAAGESGYFVLLAPLLPRLARSNHLSTREVGLLVAAYPVGMLASSGAAGKLAGRWGARPVTIVALLMLTASSLLFGFADNFVLLMTARVLQGLGAGAAWAGIVTWVVAGTPRAEQGRVLGWIFGMAFAGTVVGPAVGGLASATSQRLIFILLAGVCAAGVALTPRGPGATVQNQNEGEHGDESMFRGICASGLVLVLMGVTSGLINAFGPLRLASDHVSTFGIAAVFAVAYAAQVIVSPLIGSTADRYGPRSLAAGIALAGAASLVLVTLTSSPIPAAASVTLSYLLILALWTPGALIVNERFAASPGSRAGAMNSAWAFGVVVGGVVWSHTGLSPGGATAYLLAAAILAALGLTGQWRISRRIDTRA